MTTTVAGAVYTPVPLSMEPTEPDERLHVYGGVPPLAARACVPPATALGSVVVMASCVHAGNVRKRTRSRRICYWFR